MLAPLRRRGRLGGSGEEPVVKSCSPAWPTHQPQTLRPGERGPWHLGYAAWQLRDPRSQRFTAFTAAGPLAGSGQGAPDWVAGNLAATRKEHNLYRSGYQAAVFALDSPEVPDWLEVRAPL